MPLSVLSAPSAPPEAAVVTFLTSDANTVQDEGLTAAGFEAKAGEVCTVHHAGQPTTLAVGLGPASEISTDIVRQAGGVLARAGRQHRSMAIELPEWLVESIDLAATVEALTEGLLLGAYEFTAFKSSPSRPQLEQVFLIAPAGDEAQPAIQRGALTATAACLARDLVNEPGGSLTPARFADIAVEQGKAHGFDVKVWTEQEIRAERLGGLLGVNRGSSLPPRFVQLSYDPGGHAEVVALCGKGVTFDSGGLSLKPTEGMLRMKGDMAGAATVLAAFTALSAIRPNVKVLGFLPLTDNMTGPDATRVGDVLTIRNGKTVEVLNTDAEGRLILADALSLASETEPAAILDLATLTGACMVALGDRIAGVMGNDDDLIERVEAASAASGEPVWHMPLPDKLRKNLDSTIADIANVTKNRDGGALTAGLFLREFVADGIPWAHLDIAGPADAREDDGELVKGGTGFGVRLLLRLLSDWDRTAP